MSVPQPLQDFIGCHIDSIETAEILLLLYRSPDTFWTPTAIESHFGMKPGLAERRLKALTDARLLIKGMSGAYRYQPADEREHGTVQQLAAVYAERRVDVVNTIASENLSRLHAFAEAFRVKKEPS
ncbi:MAG TPA: hypothetical protein VFL80_06395 [Thermoanaerobaculia bacterium]|nr:hypothetical protein [Thermoanaerobaculia bacterium]